MVAFREIETHLILIVYVQPYACVLNISTPNTATTHRKLSQSSITTVAFLTHHVVVYATGDHHVSCVFH